VFAWHYGEHMFVRILMIAVTAVVLWAMFAHSSGATGPERRYVVQPRDTLWSIAVHTYAGDPRQGIWELQRRNGLDGTTIAPGQVLVLP
jgi:nucleoid-associated protein YgaU